MKKNSATKLYALAFGLFLGLCIWKFGNPVILDHKISAPETAAEFLSEPWPPHWANWILLRIVGVGVLLIFILRAENKWLRLLPLALLVWQFISLTRITNTDLPSAMLWQFSGCVACCFLEALIFKRNQFWLWLLPLMWLGWQFISTTQTVDADLTAATLWQFSGCVACYFLGALLFNNRSAQNLLLIGILAAFTFCLVRAVDQRLFEFPANQQALAEGERGGWTNFPPETVAEMRRENVILATNGAEIINPVILEKFKKARVYGTLVYPNALAGLILLLWPVSLALVFGAAKNLKPAIRAAAIALAVFLGGAAFFWSGSKLGWLIGVVIAGLFLLRLDWPKKIKLAAVALVLVGGLGIFAVRFHHYFATGAHSASARLDYWRAAVQTTAAHPVFGTGPGTFQRPYEQIKAPESEMARLAHNDWLEQFSDSGILGGLFYATWIMVALAVAGKKFYRNPNNEAVHSRFPLSAFRFEFVIFAGLLGWFAQGFGEFGLFIPATGWLAFTLLGISVSQTGFEFDKKPAVR